MNLPISGYSRRLASHVARAVWLCGLVAGLAHANPNADPAATFGAAERASPPAGAMNVIMISIDTLRADHIGAYGYERPTSPRIDELARSSVIFLEAYAPSSWTLPSHAGMLTGMHPLKLGIVDRSSALPAGVDTVANGLSRAGWDTAAFVDSKPKDYIGAGRGFARGFHEYHHAPHLATQTDASDMESTWIAARDWLLARRQQDAPFFLFLHTKSVHTRSKANPSPDDRYFPYDKPEPYRFHFVSDEDAQFSWKSEERGRGVQYLGSLIEDFRSGVLDPNEFPSKLLEVLIALYDNGIYFVDERIGRILDLLREEELASSTVVILTSDHGEEFLEHGEFLHGQIHRELLRIPLIVHVPGLGAGRIRQNVGLIDIVPTIYALTGVTRPAHLSGTPLPLHGDPDTGERLLFSSRQDAPSDPTLMDRVWGTFFTAPAPTVPRRELGVRQGEWSLIVHESAEAGAHRRELFERVDGVDQPRRLRDEPERVRILSDALESWVSGTNGASSSRIELDEDTLEHLRALGYVDDR
jgi:arylsulfatase A-like enzyme